MVYESSEVFKNCSSFSPNTLILLITCRMKAENVLEPSSLSDMKTGDGRGRGGG